VILPMVAASFSDFIAFFAAKKAFNFGVATR
jgi:hypothetical protein